MFILIKAALSLATIAVVPAQAAVFRFSSTVLDGQAISPGANPQVEVTATPEPVTFVLIGGALLALGLTSRKLRRRP
jgi:hypothetical protein